MFSFIKNRNLWIRIVKVIGKPLFVTRMKNIPIWTIPNLNRLFVLEQIPVFSELLLPLSMSIVINPQSLVNHLHYPGILFAWFSILSLYPISISYNFTVAIFVYPIASFLFSISFHYFLFCQLFSPFNVLFHKYT